MDPNLRSDGPQTGPKPDPIWAQLGTQSGLQPVQNSIRPDAHVNGSRRQMWQLTSGPGGGFWKSSQSRTWAPTGRSIPTPIQPINRAGGWSKQNSWNSVLSRNHSPTSNGRGGGAAASHYKQPNKVVCKFCRTETERERKEKEEKSLRFYCDWRSDQGW